MREKTLGGRKAEGKGGKLRGKKGRWIGVSGTGYSYWGSGRVWGGRWRRFLSPCAFEQELIYCPALNEDSPPRSPASDSSLALLPRGDINTRGNRPRLFTCCRCDFMRHFTATSVRRYCRCKILPALQ